MPSIRKLLRMYNKFILPTIILGVCFIIVYFGIIPAVRSIQNQYIQQQKVNADIVSIKKRVSTLESMDEQTLRDDVTALMTAVPPTKSIPSVISSLDTIGLQTGFTISEISIESGGNLSTESAEPSTHAAGDDDNPTISVVVHGNGTLSQVANFLDTVAGVRRLMRVGKFQSTIDRDGLVSAQFNIDAFYAPLPKTLGAPTLDLTSFSANDEELLTRVSQMPLVSQELTQYDSVVDVQYGTKTDPFSAQ